MQKDSGNICENGYFQTR